MLRPINLDALPPVTGYIFTECLYTGQKSAMYRAVTEASPQSSVVIKLLRTEYPSIYELGQMGSEIKVKSQLGQGSQFYFGVTLALRPAPPPQSLVSRASPMAELAFEQPWNPELGETGQEMLLPNPEGLQPLLRLSRTGRLRKMRQKLNQLQEQDIRFASFAQSILRLEKQFKLDEIELLLTQYVASPEPPS